MFLPLAALKTTPLEVVSGARAGPRLLPAAPGAPRDACVSLSGSTGVSARRDLDGAVLDASVAA
eukprot:8600691-Lingulodinium_polyedra.AAC.1